MLQIASFFGVGFLPKAPGTWGSLFALPFAYLLMGFFGFPLFVLLTIGLFFLGWRAVFKVQQAQNVEDPGWIVVDEVVGQWVALMPIGWGIYHNQLDPLTFLWPGYVVGFLAFRLFDIKKWGPIGWADRKGTALGVMLDDVFAGIFAAILVLICAFLYHAVLFSLIAK